MPFGRVEERVQRLAHSSPCLLEAAGDVFGDVLVAQALEPNRHGGPVERAILHLEELSHQGRLGAGKDVGGHVCLMLDVAADQTVEVRDLADVLELVERHVGAVPAALLES